MSLDLLPSYGRLATTRWDPSSISWPTPPFGMVLPICFVAKNTNWSMKTRRKLNCLWLPSQQSKNYTTNQILNGKARSATYFFQRRTIDDVSIISAFFNNPFIQIEYVWMNWVRRKKKQLRSCKFSRHDDSHIFRYNKWLLKKKFTLFLYLFTAYHSVWISPKMSQIKKIFEFLRQKSRLPESVDDAILDKFWLILAE